MPCPWVYPWSVEFKSFYDILVKNCHSVRMCSALYHLGNNMLGNKSGEHCWSELKPCQLYGRLWRILPHTQGCFLLLISQASNRSGPGRNSLVTHKLQCRCCITWHFGMFMQPLLPWKCNNAFYLHSWARYVAVNNKRNFAKVNLITAKLIHVGRGKDMMNLVPALRVNENATNKGCMYFSENSVCS